MSTRKTRLTFDKLLVEIRRSRDYAAAEEIAQRVAPQVSSWGVSQHLEHLWRVDDDTVRWLTGVVDGAVSSRESARTLPGTIVLWTGRIPRGRGRAPEAVMPQNLNIAEVLAGLKDVESRVLHLEPSLNAIATSSVARRHPVLGSYTAAQWLRFTLIHHHHHRRIIEEILSAR